MMISDVKLISTDLTRETEKLAVFSNCALVYRQV